MNIKTEIHFSRHKHRLERFVHQCGEFWNNRLTMPIWPLHIFGKHRPEGRAIEPRAKLAKLLWAVHADTDKYREFKALSCF